MRSPSDGIDWVKEEARQIIADRLGADESQALPTVIEIDGRYHMFFCYRQSFDFRTNKGRGYRIGHACSDDLVNWIARRRESASSTARRASWDSEMLCYPHVFECDGRSICSTTATSSDARLRPGGTGADERSVSNRQQPAQACRRSPNICALRRRFRAAA